MNLERILQLSLTDCEGCQMGWQRDFLVSQQSHFRSALLHDACAVPVADHRFTQGPDVSALEGPYGGPLVYRAQLRMRKRRKHVAIVAGIMPIAQESPRIAVCGGADTNSSTAITKAWAELLERRCALRPAREGGDDEALQQRYRLSTHGVALHPSRPSAIDLAWNELVEAFHHHEWWSRGLPVCKEHSSQVTHVNGILSAAVWHVRGSLRVTTGILAVTQSRPSELLFGCAASNSVEASLAAAQSELFELAVSPRLLVENGTVRVAKVSSQVDQDALDWIQGLPLLHGQGKCGQSLRIEDPSKEDCLFLDTGNCLTDHTGVHAVRAIGPWDRSKLVWTGKTSESGMSAIYA